jgi:hypothetical protein
MGSQRTTVQLAGEQESLMGHHAEDGGHRESLVGAALVVCSHRRKSARRQHPDVDGVTDRTVSDDRSSHRVEADDLDDCCWGKVARGRRVTGPTACARRDGPGQTREFGVVGVAPDAEGACG